MLKEKTNINKLITINRAFICYLFTGSKKTWKRFFILYVFLSILLTGCIRKKDPFNPEQREIFTVFFRELLVDHGGAYTLFGSKPMTIESLLDQEECEESLQYIKAHPEVLSFEIERRLEEGWEEWKKIPKNQLSKNYILTEVTFKAGRDLVFMNVPNTIATLSEYYEDFKRIAGRDFDPEKVVQELREGKKDFWGPILNNYISLGILLGYGSKNAYFFDYRVRTGDLDAGELSDKMDPRTFGAPPEILNDPRFKAAECFLEDKPFYLPIFIMLENEESKALVERYKKERELIKHRYEGKNFLAETMSQLGAS